MIDKKLQLVILHTSDIHGSLLPIYYGDNGYKNVGLSKAATIIKAKRDGNKNTVLIDSGDALQGSPLIYYFAKIDTAAENPVVKVMNHLKYDAFTVGNHEFNYGLEYLEKAKRESSFPWLSSNILEKSTGKLYFGKPYIIKKITDNLKIAIIGCTTKYIPNWEQPHIIKDLEFEDVVESLNKWVKLAKEDGADLILVSYHGGFEKKLTTGEPSEKLTGENQGYEICEKVNGVDVLLTGHQHRIICEIAINDILVSQPGFDSSGFNEIVLDLYFEENTWKIKNKSVKHIKVDDYSPDSEVINIVNPYETKVQYWLDTPIGTVDGDMNIIDADISRLSDNAYIEFINRVQMYYSEADISLTSIFDNRSKGLSNNVTMRDIVSNYIYPNTLKVLKLYGRDIKAALERSGSYFLFEDGKFKINPAFSNSKPQYYNYDMWEGIDYIINVSKPEGERIIKLNYKGSPIDMDKEYNVVMNNYRAAGGGEYNMFKGKEVIKDIPTDMSELIANYILEHKIIHATVNNNWKVIADNT